MVHLGHYFKQVNLGRRNIPAPDNFRFAIVSDRTGGHRPGVFAEAVEKLNLLKPEFVLSIGDLIEGYTHDEDEINRQWDEFDSIADKLQIMTVHGPVLTTLSSLDKKSFESFLGTK